jgi:hypothetical protein
MDDTTQQLSMYEQIESSLARDKLVCPLCGGALNLSYAQHLRA